VSENQAAYPIATMCRILGVSSSGSYAWAKRQPSQRAQADAALLVEIRALHAASHGTYGAPRIQAELTEKGLRVSRKRVARLMAAAGLVGVSRRKFVTTTVRWPSSAGPGRSQLHGGQAESAVGGRHHLHPDWRGLSVSGSRP
jgi:transposase InsO family protein